MVLDARQARRTDGEQRRYDTRFFIAAAPEGQVADGATTEAEAVVWQTPSDAINQWRSGGSLLMPPTWSQLTALSEYQSVAEILDATPDIRRFCPRSSWTARVSRTGRLLPRWRSAPVVNAPATDRHVVPCDVENLEDASPFPHRIPAAQRPSNRWSDQSIMPLC